MIRRREIGRVREGRDAGEELMRVEGLSVGLRAGGSRTGTWLQRGVDSAQKAVPALAEYEAPYETRWRVKPTGGWAVEDASFTIRTGEIVGLVGESGCGKTLTALSLVGLLPPGMGVLGGTVRFKGRDLLGLGDRELCRVRGKEISLIFQEPMTALNPLQRIGPQVGEVLALHGERDRGAIRSRVLELLGTVQLPEPEKVYRAFPHQLSGGMLQRVMIAAAVIHRPQLIIADEPTTSLDVGTQAQILTELERIHRDLGTSILFISHDLQVIRRLCRRVMVMYSGRILEEGAVGEVFAHPRHCYTRMLLASIPGKANRSTTLRGIPGHIPSIEERPQGCPFAPRCPEVEAPCCGSFPPAILVGEEHWAHCLHASPIPRVEP
jgi:oligopeptide/dipeptide ABC transporter ATP-binding protein